MLDLKLGLVKPTPEQRAQIARVIPILAQAGSRALRRMANRPDECTDRQEEK